MANRLTLTITCDHPNCHITCSAETTDGRAFGWSLWSAASTAARARDWYLTADGADYCYLHADEHRPNLPNNIWVLS